MPSGASTARSSAKAISWSVFLRSGEPFTRYSAPTISTSSGDASSMWAAYFRAFSLILPAALIAAVIPTELVREPYEPYPNGVPNVSECWTTMSSIGMPSSLDTTWAYVVSWPWPWGWVPIVTTVLPVRWTRMLADSHIAAPQPSPTAPIHFDDATPHDSMYVLSPTPSSLPRFFAASFWAARPAESTVGGRVSISGS